ncbi:MAG: cache domain-containing protein [Spirochaetales bacterium]|nr:cache domain-containing protein [Spirochaetales bacterium]
MFTLLFIVLFSITAITFYSYFQLKAIKLNLNEAYANDLYNVIVDNIIAKEQSIEKYKNAVKQTRNIALKNKVSIAYSIVEGLYNQSQLGEISENTAKENTLELLEHIRFKNDTNYFWVVNADRDFPDFMLHPFESYLNSLSPDNLEDYLVYKKQKEFINNIVHIVNENGEGSFEQALPKQIGSVAMLNKPKFMYFKLFSPWNWIIGTGSYLSDIDSEIQKRKKANMKELNITIARQGIGPDTYSFIFDENNKVIVHPLLSGYDGNKIINPETGQKTFDELKQYAVTKKCYKNKWHNSYSGEHIGLLPERAFIYYYETLKWYIVISYNFDSLNDKSKTFLFNMLFLGTIIFLFTIFLSFILSSQIIRKLNKLTDFIDTIDSEGLSDKDVPQSHTFEMSILSNTLSLMLKSIKKSGRELIAYQDKLERDVKIRARELQHSITELYEAQSKLAESEKMAALGGLVAGVAHEINTPIGIAVTASSHLQEETYKFSSKYKNNDLTSDDFEDYIKTALSSSNMMLELMNRAAEQVKSFKMVAVDQAADDLRVINLKEYINTVLLSLRPELKKYKHEINIDCDNSLEITTYPGAISQIFSNLIMNSVIHGFEDIDNGHILIKAQKAGDVISIQYSDDGKGMASDKMVHIFEPFFTTKRGQGGSGLGMNIVYNLVTQNIDGKISCLANKPSGIIFNIQLKSKDIEKEAIGND